jgi:hypothetical protein
MYMYVCPSVGLLLYVNHTAICLSNVYNLDTKGLNLRKKSKCVKKKLWLQWMGGRWCYNVWLIRIITNYNYFRRNHFA